MATFPNLTGAGAIGLTSGVSALAITVTSFGAGTSIGSAAPADYFKLGALRLGNQGFYYPVRYIDGASIWIDCPPGVTTLGYSLFTTTAIQVIEEFQPVENWQKQPWDRWTQYVVQVFQGNTGPTSGYLQAWTYTVPAGGIWRVVSLRANMRRSYAATTANYADCNIQLDGSIIASSTIEDNIVGSRDESVMSSGPLDIVAGHTLTAHYENGDVGGQHFFDLSASGYLFAA